MLNRCSGMAFGVAKKNFDEIDRAGFGGFVKKVRAALMRDNHTPARGIMDMLRPEGPVCCLRA